MIIRLLEELALFIKIALFGSFVGKFFDHMPTYALKILQQICIKIANFSKQSEYCKKSILIPLLILFGCSSESAPKPPSVAVNVASPVQQNVPVTIEAIGNIYGLTKVEVRPQVTGKLLSTEVQQGQIVNKDELLFVIDPSVYQAAYDKALATLSKDKAQLELSKKRLERNEILIKKDYVAPLTADELKAQVEINSAQIKVDQAELDQTKINLDYTRVHAYVEGKIGVFNYYPGTIVSPTDSLPLTTIEQISDVEVQFSLPQKVLEQILGYYKKEELRFEIMPPKGTVKIGEGLIFFIDNHIDLTTGTLLIKGIAKNDQQKLWPGQFVRIRLILNIKPNAILVPESALQFGQQGPYIFVINKENKAEVRKVTPQERTDNLVVVDNIKLDEKVVTQGQLNLKPGSEVMIMKDEK